MDALGPLLKGARVLDLFAGSGALGLEAMSRGAASADFVEDGASSLHALKANVAAMRATKRTRIFKRDAIQWLERVPAGAYEIAFADPPYGSRKLDLILERWADVPFARLLGVEHSADHDLPLAGLTVVAGETQVTFFERD
jgi:16S rRNA (guanine966-N2)-methyltransferase